ncbi:MAG: peptidoglycan DD-metalloendopeptidase family protein [Myxococcota bacterium]|nr:peptidoglycan DD-metalloendopeptidase family protein [Myxococcota bacterium]
MSSPSSVTSRSIFGEAPGLGSTPQLPNKLGADGKNDPEAIKAVARQFESVFLHQVFKSMRATVPKEGLMGAGFGGEVFTDMLDQQYAEIASRSQSMGLADAIASQLGADAANSPAKVAPPALRRMNAQKAYGEQQAAGHWHAPVQGEIVRGFGPQKSFKSKQPTIHTGIDIAAVEGSAVQTTRPGKVTFAGALKGYGQAVIVDHGLGSTSLYGQLGTISVASGDDLKAGAKIAHVGPGQGNQAPHVHFEVRRGGHLVDPAPMIGKK